MPVVTEPDSILAQKAAKRTLDFSFDEAKCRYIIAANIPEYIPFLDAQKVSRSVSISRTFAYFLERSLKMYSVASASEGTTMPETGLKLILESGLPHLARVDLPSKRIFFAGCVS